MVGYFIIGLVVLLVFLVAGLLFCPLIITLNSEEEQYEAELKGIARLQLAQIDDLPGLRLRLPFFKKEFSFIRDKKPKKEKTEAPKEKPTKKNGSGPSMTPAQLRALLRTFRIKQFYVSLDTGDYVKNAMLVPLFQWATHYGNQLNVNFNNETIVRFKASNNLWRLGTTYLFTAR